MIILTILKILFLFLAVLYGISLVGKLIYKEVVSAAHMYLTAIGIVGFVTLQFGLI